MFCSQCGNGMAEGVAFCSSCGTAVATPQTSAQAPSASAPSGGGFRGETQQPATASSWPPQMANDVPPRPSTPGNGFSVVGIIFGIAAIAFFPIVFGPAGLILGAVAKSKGESKAVIAMVVSGVGMVLGFIIGATIATLFW
jgi:hypothetical protein